MSKRDYFRTCQLCFDPDSWEEIESVGAGDESWDVCPSCRQIEGPTMYVTEHGERANV